MAQDPMANPLSADAVRDLADEVVDEVQDGLHDFSMAARQAIGNFRRQAGVAQAQSAAVGKSAVNCAEACLETTIKFTHRLLHARDLADVARIQAEFIEAQRDLLLGHMKTLNDVAAHAAIAIAKS